MNTQSNFCDCNACVGAQCTCGCQASAPATTTGCQCGEVCNCGEACSCADQCTCSSCSDQADPRLVESR